MLPRLFTYLCLLITITSTVIGQDLSSKSPDELRLMLEQSKPDSNRLNILYHLGTYYYAKASTVKKNIYYDTALIIFDWAARLSDTVHSKKARIRSTMLSGIVYLLMGNKAEGKRRFNEAINFYQRQKDMAKEAWSWSCFGYYLEKKPANYPEIEEYFNKAVALYKNLRLKDQEASTRYFLGNFLYGIGRYRSAERELVQSIELRSQLGIQSSSNTYFQLAVLNRYLASYEKSLDYAMKAINAAERNHDSAVMHMYYGELALTYDELGRNEESIYWYRKTIENRIATHVAPTYIIRTAGLMVKQMIKLNQSKAALAYIDSIKIIAPANSILEKAMLAQDYGYCYEGLKQYSTAEKYYLEMIELYRKVLAQSEEMCIANKDVGRFYLQRNQFENAHQYLDSALTNAAESRLYDQREIYHLLYRVDSALGHYLPAFRNLQRFQAINDSIFNIRKSGQIEELVLKYETEKKEQSIKLLENDSSLQKSELKSAQNTKRWIMGAIVLLLVFVVLLVNYSRLKVRTNKKLQSQQKEIEKKNETLQHLVDEKDWLVKEIHHRVKNNFHIVQGLLGTQSGYLKSEEAVNALADSRHRVQAMSLIHQKLYQSESLSALNMADYIHELIDYLKESLKSTKVIQFNVQVDAIELDVSNCIPVGLILNEAITNAIKYAFPGSRHGIINVSFRRTKQNQLTLTVEDNGVGFPETLNTENPVSMGMRLMRGLSEDLDGKFTVHSNKTGTEIVLEFLFDPDTLARHHSDKNELFRLT